MHFVASIVAVGSLASLASAGVGFQFPDAVPLNKRQVTGPAYECHANCGYAIQDAKDGYCTDTRWQGLLSSCLDCALTYDIWKWYGEKVGAAAKTCGLDATPKPSGGSGGGSSSQPAQTTTVASTTPASSAPASSAPASSAPVSSAPVSSAPVSSAPVSSAPATSAPASSHSSAPGQSSQSTTAPRTSAQTSASSQVRSTSAATTAKPSASAAPTSSRNATSTQVQVGAAAFQQPAMLAAGAVALVAVNMI
ncbi:hypothetical protein CCM_07103 [Cordyceps militaris CM01]|uniref:Uncharacterized protein n=1 Tax=Cordyceps militaris (strain CM01) TaxID=983644 RepID=G3JLV9_CORMM|nr:uncharacterized protein CCM_07103 [Cordyceps militaris CM01]EGX90683.1 hypothetical protein CCM_07103 [Cordyceps militaris CM01]